MKMLSTILIFCGLCFLHEDVSGADLIAELLKLKGACFPEVQVPRECNMTIPESFQSTYNTFTGSEPTTHVYLFTPDNPDVAEPLHKCGGRLPPDTTYDREADTEIFIHGWLDGVCRTAWMREMKEQLKQRGRYNVILVDWSWGNTIDLAKAGFQTRIVGEQVGFVVNNIMNDAGVGPEKFHIIGHSYGAIVSGYAGRSIKGLRRITGLDPGYIIYAELPPDERLTYRDAQIVDIIHSNGYDCFILGFGDPNPLGHADFYPNGGQQQGSCLPYFLISVLKLDLIYGILSLLPSSCSHLQALQYYKLSINSNGCEYVGIESSSYKEFKETSDTSKKSWAVMGMNYELYHNKSKEVETEYYLTTSDFCPYYDSSYLDSKERFPFKVDCGMNGFKLLQGIGDILSEII